MPHTNAGRVMAALTARSFWACLSLRRNWSAPTAFHSRLRRTTAATLERFMTRIRTYISPALILACFVGASSLAQSQTQTQPTSKPAETSMPKMEDVSKWTQKQWNAAKAKWSEEKTKWNDCQNQAKTKNLSGRKSWQFLYDCMAK
jgi:hypothetical protein